MRIALIGSAGQLGSDLSPRLQLAGHQVFPLTHADVDVTNAARLAAVLDPLQPEFVINTAAYNFVDRAEDEPHLSFAVNALGPRNLARQCEQLGVPLLHVSTDYVFGAAANQHEPFLENDTPCPTCVYGQSKLAGEYFVRAECSRHFVVRTCGLYGIAALRGKGKGNFVETLLRLGRERKPLRVVDDQRCAPTATADLADALVGLIATTEFGLYHATNSGSATWCEFAREIFRQMPMDVEVLAITTAEFGAKARRPTFSVLNCDKLTNLLGAPLPDWHVALSRYLQTQQGNHPATN